MYFKKPKFIKKPKMSAAGRNFYHRQQLKRILGEPSESPCNVYPFSNADADYFEIEPYTGNFKIILAATSETGIAAEILSGRQGTFTPSIDPVNDPQWVQYEVDGAIPAIVLEATFTGVCGGYAKDDVWYSVDMGASPEMLLNLLPVTGQSLSIGNASFSEVINQGALDGAFLFTGVNPTSKKDVAIEPVDVATIEPYAEVGTQTHGHSMIRKLQESIDGDWLYASHGKGSSSVEELSHPSVMYDNGMAMIEAGKVIAAELGSTYRIPFLDFVQGESGSNSKVNLRTLHDLYIVAVNAQTGQSDLPMILDQTGFANGSTNAISRFEYCEENDDAYMACTKYPLNRLFPSNPAGDWTHLDPSGYLIQGEYHGIAGAAVVNGEDFKTLQPLSYEVVGTTIEITMHVPVTPMILDALTLPQCPSEGFLYEAYYEGDIVPAVTISGDKIILDVGYVPMYRDKISFGLSLDDSATHPSGAQIPCGNIRDSQSIASEVAGFTLHNWLVQFDHEMQKSEGTNPELWRFDDPVVTAGGTAGDTIAGATSDSNAAFEVGQFVHVQFKYNGTGQFRNRTSATSTTFTGDGTEKTADFMVEITDDIYQRNMFQHWGDGFVGTIYDISVQVV